VGGNGKLYNATSCCWRRDRGDPFKVELPKLGVFDENRVSVSA